MTSSKKDAAALAAKAEIARKRYEDAQREESEAREQFNTEAAARRQKFMRDWLENEFVQAPEAEVARLATLAAFEEAVQADPLMGVWLAHLRSNMRVGADAQTSQNFAQQTGVPVPVSYPRAGSSHFFEIMDMAIQRLAARLEGERTADIFDALEAAADGEGE